MSRAIENFSKAIQIKTVSNADNALVDWNEFEKFHKFLEESYPLFHSKFEKETVAKASLLYCWKGSKSESTRPYALLGHMDVVPVSKETEKFWKYPPFNGINDGEYMWGRGANDMKCHIVAIMESLESLIAEGFEPQRDIYVLFGHNEEVSLNPISGAREIARLLAKQNTRLEFVLDEGGAILEDPPMGITVPAAMIGVAEKGYVDMKIEISADGGHASDPPKHTALGELSMLINAIENNPMKSRLIPTVEGTFRGFAPHLKGLYKFLFSNIKIFKPIVTSALASDSLTGSMVRTTIAPTMAHASDVPNVLPQKASAVLNIRLLPGDKIEDVQNHILALAKKLRIDSHLNFEIVSQLKIPGQTPLDTPTFKIIEELVKKDVDNKCIALPYMVSGTTDSLEYSEVADEIYRIYPFLISQEELATMHTNDERIKIDSFEKAIEFLKDFVTYQDKR